MTTPSAKPEEPTDQDKLIEFMTDPETIKRAVEGSMDKRLGTPKVDELEELLDEIYQTNPNDDQLPRDVAKAAIEALCTKRVEEAVYGFHEYVIGKDIIRAETDQAFNYGRLHHAIDDYISQHLKY